MGNGEEVIRLHDIYRKIIFFSEYSGRISKDAVLPSLKGKYISLSKMRQPSKPMDLTLILEHICLFEIGVGQNELRDISYIVYAILKFSTTQTFNILVMVA